MCRVCMSVPCHPRCPNAPEPVEVFNCCKCGEGIQDGEKYYDSLGGYVCEDCIDDMTAREFMELIGEKFSIVEKEEFIW